MHKKALKILIWKKSMRDWRLETCVIYLPFFVPRFFHDCLLLLIELSIENMANTSWMGFCFVFTRYLRPKVLWWVAQLVLCRGWKRNRTPTPAVDVSPPPCRIPGNWSTRSRSLESPWRRISSICPRSRSPESWGGKYTQFLKKTLKNKNTEAVWKVWW